MEERKLSHVGPERETENQGRRWHLREIHNKIEGEVHIDGDDLTLHGTIVGPVVVEPGRYFALHGMLIGALDVHKGARVDVHGTVIGSITSHGGHVTIHGVLDGAMAGETFELSPDAVIRDRGGDS